MRIGAFLHPSVLLALADAACFPEHVIARPRSVRIAGLGSPVISMEVAPDTTSPVSRRLFRHKAGIPSQQSAKFSPCAETTLKNASRCLPRDDSQRLGVVGGGAA